VLRRSLIVAFLAVSGTAAAATRESAAPQTVALPSARSGGDEGAKIDPASLKLTGSTLSWTDAAGVRTAAMP
jgi:hypothetical protein